MNDLDNLHQQSSPHQEAVGDFVVPTEKTEESSLLNVPDESQASPKEIGEHDLTYKQQLKQDAMLWAEFLYGEYKREKVLLEEAQTMPTHYDDPTA